MTFTRPISQSLSPTYRPNANCINRRIHSRVCFLRISLCLTYFFFLAIQLSICGVRRKSSHCPRAQNSRFGCKSRDLTQMVGSSGLEPPTSRLSGVCSNLLSYEPVGGGGKRIRTDDPLLAGQVLYQLSYTPIYINAVFRR